MASYPKREEVRATGRRHPVGYKLHGLEAPLFVPGHYPADSIDGGCDTLPDTDEIFGRIWEAYEAGYSVLFEGRNVSLGLRLATLFDPAQCEIVVVDHPLSQCIEAIKNRGGRITVETIKRFERKIADDEKKLTDRGYAVHRLSRSAAMEKCRSLVV